MQYLFGFDVTYRSWNEKPGKQIPETEEKGHNNCSNLVAWSECNNHHPIHCEVDEAHQYVVVEPEEFGYLPLKSNHRVEDKSVDKSLNCNIDCLYGHLQKK